MTEQTKRRFVAVWIIGIVCLAVAVNTNGLEGFVLMILVPLIYVNGYLHGKGDELDNHLETLNAQMEWVKGLKELLDKSKK